MQPLKPIILLVFLLALGGCVSKEIHQGNIIDPDNVWIIQEGDTRFAIESEIGSPAIKDTSQPRRAVYIDYFFDEALKKTYTRSVEVIYDEAWRAKSIHRTGFE